MAELLSLRGRNALSPFRISKLLSSLSPAGIAAIHAEYWHFVQTERGLTSSERSRLERILTYGSASEGERKAGVKLLVIPRPGTISPWASKATDIAHGCGLACVTRIERGIVYHVQAAPRDALPPPLRRLLSPLIPDPLTHAA